MYISNLKLRKYRNIDNLNLEFVPGMNILIGNNGQGKTNILEAVYYLSTTKSHRNVDDLQLVMNNEDFATIDSIVHYSENKNYYSAVIHKKGKNLSINHNPAKKVSEFVGKLNAIIFSPLDMNMFDDSPATRRRLLDIELGKMSKVYINYLNEYTRLLKSRNNYLKADNPDSVLIDTLSEQMVKPQVEILKQRYRLIRQLNNEIEGIYQFLNSSNDRIRIEYYSPIPYSNDEDEMIKNIKAKQESYKERDYLTKMTNFGTHRDDLSFYLNDKPVIEYASQGQKRSFIIAIKIGLLRIIKENIGEYPVLLLDDVLSELDKTRRNQLVKLLPNDMQTIITATDTDNISKELLDKSSIKIVKEGSVESWKN